MRASALCVSLVHLVGCGRTYQSAEGALASGGADAVETLPQVEATMCGTAPASLPLAPFLGNVQSVPTASFGGWNSGWHLIGGFADHLFVFGCGGGKLASGCDLTDITQTSSPLYLPRPRVTGPVRAWSNAEGFLFPADSYYHDHAWQSADDVTGGQRFIEVAGTSTRDLWLLTAPAGDISHVVDGIATPVPRPNGPGYISKIRASADNALWGLFAESWAWASEGDLLRCANGAWERTGLSEIRDLSAPADGSVWALSGNAIYRFEQGCWVSWSDPRVSLDGVSSTLRGVWAGSTSDVWVTGDDNILRHWDGQAWSLRPIAAASNAKLGEIWGSPSGVWVLMRYEGELTDWDLARNGAFFLTPTAVNDADTPG